MTKHTEIAFKTLSISYDELTTVHEEIEPNWFYPVGTITPEGVFEPDGYYSPEKLDQLKKFTKEHYNPLLEQKDVKSFA